MKEKLKDVQNTSSEITKSESEWIAVKDARPEYNVPVLICDEERYEDTLSIGFLESQMTNAKGTIFYWCEGRYGSEYVGFEVTHWRAYPSPPLG